MAGHTVSLHTLALLCLIFTSLCVSKTSAITTTQCEYYNSTMCLSTGRGCNGTQECDDQMEPDKRNHCYVLWNQTDTGKPFIKLKGCFLNSADCYDNVECIDKRSEPKKKLMFCCCEGDMCNRNFTWEPPVQVSTVSTPTELPPMTPVFGGFLMYTLIPIMFVIFVVFMYWVYKRLSVNQFNEIPTTEPHPLPPSSPTIGHRSIQLQEIKARGRFGAVWKAKYRGDDVAVKIFPVQDKQSWLTEKEIYKLPHMQHKNILQYIGVEERGDNITIELWLITAYHDLGCLCDFLKANTVTWPELCRIAESMSQGLMHLHEEIPPAKGEGFKPSIAHRDFKSKNVLLKSDLTACIADFGLALVFEPGTPCGDTHGQVGTRRYMAPEVLEGAISFSRDAFLRIDMYACGLVMWELISRCRAQEGPIGEYMLPFEEEVGQHPTLEDMQECVVHKKNRPVLKETWKNHVGMAALCNTVEDCWDQDAEARLSASCVAERIASQTRLLPPSLGTNISTTSNRLPTLVASVPLAAPPHLESPFNQFCQASTRSTSIEAISASVSIPVHGTS